MEKTDPFANYPQIARIEWLQLHNFKSFQGDHHIGPFLNLTAIIGPNGGGKSNLLDAICFVMLIRTPQSREANLRQLIYRTGKEPPETKAWVEMQFADKEARRTRFKRVVHPKGQTVYYLDGDAVPRERYIEALESHSIIKNTRSHCAIMQGEIDSILHNSSKEIPHIIEELSGSAKFAANYEELKARLEQSQTRIATVSKNIQELRKEKRKAKGLKSNIEAFEKTRGRLGQLRTDFYVATCAFHELRARELMSKAKELEEKMQAQNEAKEGDVKQMQEFAEKLEELSREAEEKERDQERLKMVRGQAEKNIRTAQTKVDVLRKEREAKEIALSELSRTAEEGKKKRQSLEEEKRLLQEECDKLAEEIKKVDKRSKQQKNGASQQEEYYRIKSEVESQTFDMQNELKRLNAHLEGYWQKMSVLDEVAGQLNSQLAAAKAQSAQLDTETLRRELENKRTEQEEMAKLYADAVERQKARAGRIADLEVRFVAAEYETKRIEQQQEFRLSRGREYQLIEQLKTKIRGCRGLLSQLISACEKKYDIAVKFGVGKYLSYLVVDDESAAASCNIFLKDAGIMKDILILANIPRSAYITPSTSTIPPESCAPGSVRLIDAIDYNASIKRLKETIVYIAGRKVVCNDLASARKLLAGGFKEIITLGGEVLRQGAISGGSNEAIAGLELSHKDYAEKKRDSEKELASIKAELDGLNKSQLSAELVEAKRRLEAAGSAVSELQSRLATAQSKAEILSKQSDEAVAKMQSTQSAKSALAHQIESTSKEIEETKRGVEELSHRAFESFCKSWNLSSIAQYEGKDLLSVNAMISRRSQLVSKIDQCNAQLELARSDPLVEKREKVEADVLAAGKQITELELRVMSEQRKSAEVDSEYRRLTEEVAEIGTARAQTMGRQRELAEQIALADEAVGEFKKDFITCVCQVKTNAHMKLRTIDEMKLKDISVPMEEIAEHENMLTPMMERDYRIDYNKYDIDVSLVTSAELEQKIQSTAQAIAEEEKALAEFNALALMKDESEDLGELDGEIELARKELDQISRQHDQDERLYKKAKENRKQAFKTCYDLLSTYLDGIYQELTRTEETGFVYGGHALLVPENVGEPYNGEIQYVPTPSGKRVVYELDQLSGGEKALAALALILAIQRYQESPILILDEVDAHLDVKNVARLAEAVAKNGMPTFQCVMVSHKESLAAKCHSVIGVVHSKPEESSKALSLDLRTAN